MQSDRALQIADRIMAEIFGPPICTPAEGVTQEMADAQGAFAIREVRNKIGKIIEQEA